MSSLIGDIVAREAQLLGVALSSSEIDAFERYAMELKKWNSKINLTAITKDREIAIKHFIDSLHLAPYLSTGDRLLDIGSGAGLPVLPLKIIRPEISMVSVDAVAKKIHFQRHIIRLLDLKNIKAVHARIEELHKAELNSFTVIISRAFTRLDRFVALASPFLAEGGVLIAMKGEQAECEISASDSSLQAGGFTVVSTQRYVLPENMGERVLTVLKSCKAP
ncbi:MAG TPA: 16S rRNA (guanine(527)-N(7))-methyltransferase RsmG [Desulfuromonadales bacterium]|nr:16S rRNA (guanine(527)-N(7))-methyltransferase RsmG [Desulfuromonadales bacterium]